MWYIADTPVPDTVQGLVVSLFLFTSLALIVVGLRVYTRVRIVRKMEVDDYLIVVAMASSITYLLASIGEITFGLGTPAMDFDSIYRFLKSQYADVICYTAAAIIVKFSLLLQYRRLFETPKSRWAFIVMIAWLGTYSLVAMALSIFTCLPVAKYWDATVSGGCLDRQLLQYFIGGFNVFNDFVLLGVPVPFLRTLRIDVGAKIALMAVFACGAFACVVSVVRLWSLYVSNSAPINQQPIFGVDITVWSGLEINIAIICASIPSLKPFVAKLTSSPRQSMTAKERLVAEAIPSSC